MIDGITVLSQTEIMEAPYNQIIIIISFVILTIILAVLEYHLTNDFSLVSMFFALLLSIAIGLAYYNIAKEPTGKYEYKVLIDKSASFIEFTEQYNVIKKDGTVYTIRDIEHE